MVVARAEDELDWCWMIATNKTQLFQVASGALMLLRGGASGLSFHRGFVFMARKL